MYCETCGVEEELFNCKIEGTYLNVCKNCSQHGTVIKKVEEPKILEEKKVKKEEGPARELIQVITPDYSSLIKEKREKLGLKQKDLAKEIAEKESVIHKLEAKKTKPDMRLARKLEKFLKIKLVEQHEEAHAGTIKKGEEEGLTIGDLIKIK